MVFVGFAPFVGWRIGYGHLTLLVGLLPFVAGWTLLIASCRPSPGSTLSIVSVLTMAMSLPFVGQQLVLYGLVFGPPLAAGAYLLQTTYAGKTLQSWLQVTDIATFVSMSSTKTIVWTNDVASGGPISGAKIELVGASRSLGATNDQGVLYGAVTQQEIATAMNAAGYGIKPRDVRIHGAIKRVDTYDVLIKFETDLESHIKLKVQPYRTLEKEEREEMDFDNEGNLIEPGSRGRGRTHVVIVRSASGRILAPPRSQVCWYRT